MQLTKKNQKKQKPVNKNRVNFVLDDIYLEKHSFTYNELLPSWCSLVLRSWVTDQERKEKRRLNYAERQKTGSR